MNIRSPLQLAFLALCALLTLIRPGSVSAQENTVTIASLRVDIWPEYDQPSVLVIYHMTLSPEVSLPATVAIPIPAAVEKPHAVAMQDVAGLYNLNYKLNAAGEWIEVEFTTPVPDVRVEFYDPTLAKDGSNRAYQFNWPGSYTVENFSISVQQPLNASSMTFLPTIGSGVRGEDGLTYYNLAAGRVPEGTSLDLQIQYEKPDDTLTSPQQFQPAQPSQPVSTSAAGRMTLNEMLPWLLGGLGVLLIAAGLVWYWRTGRAPVRANAAAHHHGSRPRHTTTEKPAAASGSENAAFCHQCGKRATPGDVFCRACGTKLRS